MRRGDASPFGDLLQKYLRSEGLETPLNEKRLIDAWPEVMGKVVASYTSNLYIRNQVLYVKVTSAALRNHLWTERKTVVERLNKHVGTQVISDMNVG